MVQLTPNPLTQNLPAFLIHIAPASRAIYGLCLFLVAGGGICLPLVRVHVSVSGNGIIRPGQEKAKIIPGVSGLVEEVYVSEGEHVTMAAPILKLRSYDAGRDLQLLKMELRDTDQYIADLKGLNSDPLIPPAGRKYRSAYREFCQRMEYLALVCEKSDREWTRQTGLFRAGLISEKEFDDLAFTKARANQEKTRIVRRSSDRVSGSVISPNIGQCGGTFQVPGSWECDRKALWKVPPRVA